MNAMTPSFRVCDLVKPPVTPCASGVQTLVVESVQRIWIHYVVGPLDQCVDARAFLDKQGPRMPGVASFSNGNVASRACKILVVQKNLYWLPCFLEFSFPMGCDLLGSGIPGGGEAFNVV
jgi:hypothetical protein